MIGDFERRMLMIVLYVTSPVWALVYGLILGALTGWVGVVTLFSDLHKLWRPR